MITKQFDFGIIEKTIKVNLFIRGNTVHTHTHTRHQILQDPETNRNIDSNRRLVLDSNPSSDADVKFGGLFVNYVSKTNEIL